MKKQNIFISIVLLVTVVILAIPFIQWLNIEKKDLNILIVDKTVEEDSYCEHKRIVHVLNHYKYNKEDKEEYTVLDYVGFRPKKDLEYEIDDVENKLKKDYDLLYVADTNGVYEEEYYGENSRGNRSQIIYGGLSLEEAEQIEKQVEINQTPLIVEYNTFAQPTSKKSRNIMESVLNVKWTGWIGRYFDNLNYDANEEIPTWIKDNYEKQYNQNWEFKNGGFVLADQSDHIIVLEDNEDFLSKGLKFSFSKEGKDFFNIKGSVNYDYWFDIIKSDSSQVMATYNWDLNDGGKEKLEKYNLPSSFPAITRHLENNVPIYYFAGDFADSNKERGLYRYYNLNKIMTRFKRLSANDDQRFQWQIYYPVMEAILEEAYELK